MFSAMILAKRTLLSTGLPAAVVRGSYGPERISQGVDLVRRAEGALGKYPGVGFGDHRTRSSCPSDGQPGRMLGHCLAALVQHGQGRLGIGHDMA